MLFEPATEPEPEPEPEPELEVTQKSLTRLSVCDDEIKGKFYGISDAPQYNID